MERFGARGAGRHARRREEEKRKFEKVGRYAEIRPHLLGLAFPHGMLWRPEEQGMTLKNPICVDAKTIPL